MSAGSRANSTLERIERILGQVATTYQTRLDRVENALRELLARSAPPCPDTLEAVERALEKQSLTPGSPQGRPPVSPTPHLVASPEVGEGDAPQGFDERGVFTNHAALTPVESAFPDLAIDKGQALHSLTYCAICDGDSLPAAVRLKGGGFVCEGCVIA